jgi:hypothetical protein
MALYRIKEVMMDCEKAMRLLETGKADCIFASVLILRIGKSLYLSFNGKEWEEIDSELINKQF